jgi:hypothetical protein
MDLMIRVDNLTKMETEFHGGVMKQSNGLLNARHVSLISTVTIQWHKSI